MVHVSAQLSKQKGCNLRISFGLQPAFIVRFLDETVKNIINLFGPDFFSTAFYTSTSTFTHVMNECLNDIVILCYSSVIYSNMQKSLPGLTSTSCEKAKCDQYNTKCMQNSRKSRIIFHTEKKKTCEAVNQFIQFISII